jgi:diacylglycerol kinase family enzyme
MYGGHTGRSGVIYRRVKRVEILSEARLPVQLDGDSWVGEAKTFDIVPAALTMMVPKDKKIASLSPRGAVGV